MAVSGEKSGSHWSPGVWQREESCQATGSARGQHPLRVLTCDPWILGEGKIRVDCSHFWKQQVISEVRMVSSFRKSPGPL